MEDFGIVKVLNYKFIFRGSTSDISDLAWSPDNNFIIAACLDNTSRIYSVPERKTIILTLERCVQVLTNHCHFVQGVSWDPKNMYLATQSNDR